MFILIKVHGKLEFKLFGHKVFLIIQINSNAAMLCHLLSHHYRGDLIVLHCHGTQPGIKLMRLQTIKNDETWKKESLLSEGSLAFLFLDSRTNIKMIAQFLISFACILIVSAEGFQVIFFLMFQRHSSPNRFSCIGPKVQSVLTLKCKGCMCSLIFCVITSDDCLFSQDDMYFSSHIIFQKNYIPWFYGEQCPFTEI